MSDIACDQQLRDVLGLVATAAAFSNPCGSAIDGIKNEGFNQQAAVQTAILNLDPMDPNYATNLLNLTNLNTSLVSLGGSDHDSFLTSPMGQFWYHTQFMSGQLPVFPAGPLSSLTSGIPGLTLISYASFATVLGMAGAVKPLNQETCSYDPQDPCAGVNAMFGTMLGTFNPALNALSSFLSGMTDLVNNALSYISQIADHISQVVNQIVGEITNAAATLLKSVQYALARLLTGLKVDPCVASVIKGIGTEALIQTLGII